MRLRMSFFFRIFADAKMCELTKQHYKLHHYGKKSIEQMDRAEERSS